MISLQWCERGYRGLISEMLVFMFSRGHLMFNGNLWLIVIRLGMTWGRVEH